MQRRADVVSYDRRVAAARRVVGSGLASGYRVFNIMSGVKDLDLAVKEDPRLADHAGDVLVLTDVPASFVIVPAALAAAAAPLLAQPPLPPSGAYRFGDARVVGLARRGDGPSLREVWQRFPDIRFVRLLRSPAAKSSPATSLTRRDSGWPRRGSTTRVSTTKAMPGKIDGAVSSNGTTTPCACSRRPSWSRVEDDSVMQWPVVELAEWEELRLCPDCGRHWLASWPDEVEGGMILCSPEPASARRLRDIDRAVDAAGLLPGAPGRAPRPAQGAQARVPQGRLRSASGSTAPATASST